MAMQKQTSIKRKSGGKRKSVTKRRSETKKRTSIKRKSGTKKRTSIKRKSGTKKRKSVKSKSVQYGKGKKTPTKKRASSKRKSGTKKRTIQHGKGNKIDWMEIDCDIGFIQNKNTGECDEIIINPRSGRALVPHSKLLKNIMKIDVQHGKIFNNKTGIYQNVYTNSSTKRLNKIVE